MYSPRVWGTWLIVAIGWLLARLPMSAIGKLGRWLGRIAYRLARSRRHIAEVNFRLCFPDLGEAARREMIQGVFQHVAVGALETMVVWLDPDRDLGDRVTIEGLEHLRAAQAEGRGVLLVGGHFTSLDVMANAVSRAVDLDVIYRANKNPVWEWLQVRGRSRYCDGVIERSDVRQMIARLKAGRTIWYAPDQDYGPKHSVFAPFFGAPAASITATSRLAKISGSPVIFASHFRDWNTMTWHVKFSEPLDGFPTSDEVADAARVNQVIENAIRAHPDQYLWIHRRFKTRPPGEAKLY
jgi:KDO2-lipid IV(A) lauroyltransferase